MTGPKSREETPKKGRERPKPHLMTMIWYGHIKTSSVKFENFYRLVIILVKIFSIKCNYMK